MELIITVITERAISMDFVDSFWKKGYNYINIPVAEKLFEVRKGEEYESITDALCREVKEETGLILTLIRRNEESVLKGQKFEVQCVEPFCAYQTTKGPVDSFGLHFICEATGELLQKGDDSDCIHWANIQEIRQLMEQGEFLEVDVLALQKYIQQLPLTET